MCMKYDKNTNSAILSKYSLQQHLYSTKTALTLSPKLGHCEQQSLNGHTCTFAASSEAAEKSVLVHGKEKLYSKFGKDQSLNPIAIFSTDAEHQTSDTSSDFIFCPMLYIALDRQLVMPAILCYLLSTLCRHSLYSSRSSNLFLLGHHFLMAYPSLQAAVCPCNRSSCDGITSSVL